MTDTQSGLQEPEAGNDDPQTRFLKSLITVFKENRDVLPSLPEMMEQCLEKEPRKPNLAETQHEEEYREDDRERLAYRKRKEMEKKLESLEEDIEVKTKRITALDQTIKEKNATFEALKREENTVMSAKDRKSAERELKKKDKQIEASEKQVKVLEEENMKLKSELETKGKEISQVKLQEEKILAVKNELEKSVKEMSDKEKQMEEMLLKKDGNLQQIYGDYNEALKTHKSSYDSMIKELEAKDEKIEAYNQRLSKMKEDLKNAHAKMDLYKSRLAALSEKRVKQDQRLVEDTLGLNRQSELERDFSAFFDEDRMDACEKMQSIYHNKEEDYLYIYYPRLACIILETAYEQVTQAKEAASDLFKELIKNMIDSAPLMGQTFAITRIMGQIQICTVPINVNTWGDGSECSKDVMDGMMLSLKEVAHTCNLDSFVISVLTIAHEKWTKWYDEDVSCMFTPALNLVQGLEKFAKACLRLTWRMVTQVPPMKLEFHSSKFSEGIHKNMGYLSSFKRLTRNTQPAHHDQNEEIAYYLWPGLQDGGGRLIRAGEVICKAEVP